DTSLMLLASVSKLRLDKEGLPRVNTSVITLPPHREFLDIHHKSFPLILNLSEIEQWLDPTIPTSEFNELLHQTTFRQDFTVTQVNEKCQPVSDTIVQFKARKPS
ncbi:MAG: SOS response-associated peptidase family protein, partial [Reinekea sp.]|nr:SOS response-associated peptidase family protein [Reinekea sp.]